MGALAVRSNGKMSEVDGDLTYLGHVVARLPVDPHLAKLIVLGYIFGCLQECVIIGGWPGKRVASLICCLCALNFFFYRFVFFLV